MQEKPRNEKKEIEILDKGIDMQDTIGPEWLCCFGSFMAFRW